MMGFGLGIVFLSLFAQSFASGRTGIVNLFEWKFSDIADECVNHLGPDGYYGVLTSPINEYIVINNPPRPWWERYQPMSYLVISRSGDLEGFQKMTKACNEANVRIFVDVVINHMSATWPDSVGTSGVKTDTTNKNYVNVPYTSENFHTTCAINDYQNATNVRVCELVGLHDLDQSQDYVREKIIDYLNTLIDNGASGFRVDAAKHVWPVDLQYIYGQLNNLNSTYGLDPKESPYVYQEVVDYGGEPVSGFDYIGFGSVSNFKFGMYIGQAFRSQRPLSDLKTLGEGGNWDMVPSDKCVVFVENHDTERSGSLNYKDGNTYKMAVSFLLSWNYGRPQIMSGYEFDSSDQGPPHNDDYTIADVPTNPDGSCGDGWTCQHRWAEFKAMIQFANTVQGTSVSKWWDNGASQVAFSRGNLGFIAFNLDQNNLSQTLNTGLSAGTYCDLITGGKVQGECAGESISVDGNGNAAVNVGTGGVNILAVTVDSKL